MKLSYYKGYHWPHILFFTLTPLVAIGGITWRIVIGTPWGTWVLALVMLALCGLSTTGGYHRLFSHKSYQAGLPLRLFYLLFGAAAFEGSVRWWACGHRTHHLYTDTQQDPYGINKGFWHAHIGWLFTKDQEPPNFDHVKDLDQDPWILLQDRFFPMLAVLVGWFLPTAVASLWGDPWGGFLIAGLARMVVNHHTTFCINSVCHSLGRQPYSDQDSARDSWLSALLTYGEGYHNYHHAFPNDYRNGIRFFHWDPTKWFIKFSHWLGLAKDLRKVRKEKILLAKILMDQKRFASRLPDGSEAVRQRAEAMLLAARTQLQEAYARFQEMQQKLKEVKWEEIRSDYRRAKAEFKVAMARWRALLKGPIVLDSLTDFTFNLG